MTNYIREWRQAGGAFQSGLLNNAQPMHDAVPSPTVSASRKRQKTSQALPSSSLGAPSSALNSQQVAASMQPSLSAAKRTPAAGSKSKNPKSVCLEVFILIHIYIYIYFTLLKNFSCCINYLPISGSDIAQCTISKAHAVPFYWSKWKRAAF